MGKSKVMRNVNWLLSLLTAMGLTAAVLFFWSNICLAEERCCPSPPPPSPQQKIQAFLDSQETFSNLANGIGGTASINDHITAIARAINECQSPELKHSFKVVQDKGYNPSANWAYSGLNVGSQGFDLQGFLTKLDLNYNNSAQSKTILGSNASATAKAIVDISLNSRTRADNFSTSVQNKITSVTWGDVLYQDQWGQAVSAGAQLDIFNKVNTSGLRFTKPIIQTNISLNAKSTAVAPDAKLTAGGSINGAETTTMKTGGVSYRIDTSAALFGSGNIHNGEASVKITKTHTSQ